MTEFFTIYVDTVQKLYQLDGGVGWTEEKINRLKEDIKSFKTQRTSVFLKFHLAKKGTMELHMLDHVCDKHKNLRNIQFMDVELYENLHAIF